MARSPKLTMRSHRAPSLTRQFAVFPMDLLCAALPIALRARIFQHDWMIRIRQPTSSIPSVVIVKALRSPGRPSWYTPGITWMRSPAWDLEIATAMESPGCTIHVLASVGVPALNTMPSPEKGYSLTDCISMQTMRREGLTRRSRMTVQTERAREGDQGLPTHYWIAPVCKPQRISQSTIEVSACRRGSSGTRRPTGASKEPTRAFKP